MTNTAMSTPPTTTPDINQLRQDLGIPHFTPIEQEVKVEEIPKLPNGEVNLDALATKVRAQKS